MKQQAYLWTLCLVSAMGGLLFGYDWVVIGGAKIFYEPFFGLGGAASLRGWAMSCALVGCLAGALLSGAWSDRYGRKRMLLLAALLFTVSAVGTGVADRFGWFVVARIVGGLGIGIASNVSPVYIAEVTPARLRGRFVSINQLTTVLGILLAQVVNWRIGEHFTGAAGGALTPESVEWAWRWMLWAAAVPALVFLVLALFVPESPRWSALRGRTEAARRVLTRIGGERYATETLASLSQLSAGAGGEGTSGWRALKAPGLGGVLLVGIVLAVFQQWCGLNVVFNYAHEVFSAAGYAVSDILMNIVVTGVTNVVFTFVAIRTVDRWGRRALMLFGSASLAVIYAVLGACYWAGVSGVFMLALVVLAIACYAMSLAPVTWVVLSEIFPARVRGVAMAVSTFFLWAASFVLTYTFPSLNEAVGAAGAFWLYGAICVAGFLFILRRLPETKGKTLEQLEQELTRR